MKLLPGIATAVATNWFPASRGPLVSHCLPFFRLLLLPKRLRKISTEICYVINVFLSRRSFWTRTSRGSYNKLIALDLRRVTRSRDGRHSRIKEARQILWIRRSNRRQISVEIFKFFLDGSLISVCSFGKRQLLKLVQWNFVINIESFHN